MLTCTVPVDPFISKEAIDYIYLLHRRQVLSLNCCSCPATLMSFYYLQVLLGQCLYVSQHNPVFCLVIQNQSSDY